MEVANDLPIAPPPRDRGAGGSPRTWERGRFQSIQVNVDPDGANIPGDAANEPSLAVDPTNPQRMVIGFRQFDTVESDWRKSGWAYSHDGGNTWTFPGVLIDDFGSDPVLAADADGTFYYFRHAGYQQFCKSLDGGVTWDCGDCPYHKGDKPWMTVDRTQGPGRGNIYASWSGYEPGFTRSTDGGSTFMPPLDFGTHRGTLAVGVDGELYMTSNGGILRSSNAQFHDQIPRFELERSTWIPAEFGYGDGWWGPNPLGLVGQPWVDVDRSDGAFRGNVYVLGSTRGRVPFQPCGDPLDVRFTRSSDRGEEWSRPRRITDFPPRLNAFDWFGCLSVAPNGRLDAVWNDTRHDPKFIHSELYYSFSLDAGETWSRGIPVSHSFNHFQGYPEEQKKIGDYYHIISENDGVNVAYAATFNGEQDIYFLRIDWTEDCDGNGRADLEETADATAADCDGNGQPDVCDADCNGNGRPDACDIENGSSADCNNNAVPDECDIADAESVDCNWNDIPDECEPDCNDNGIADACDVTRGNSSDCNSNGTPDECEAPIGMLERLRLHMNVNHSLVTSIHMALRDFEGGDEGNSILPDGSDLFDGGNVLNTDRQERIPYTRGAIRSDDSAFGDGSRYFTRKYPGMFFLAADDMAIKTFSVTGKAKMKTPRITRIPVEFEGQQYTVFARWGSAGGVACLAMIPGDGGEVKLDPDRGLMSLTGLGSARRMYYFLLNGAVQESNLGSMARRIAAFHVEPADCNANGVPDDCDVASGEWADENGTGVPDACERIIYVNSCAEGNQDGSSWNDAYRGLQDALRDASTSEAARTEIWIAAGTYTPAPAGGDRMARFVLPDRVSLFGGFGGWEAQRSQRDTALNHTIVSGDLNGDDGAGGFGDNARALVQATDVGTWTKLDGLDLTAARAEWETQGAITLRRSGLGVTDCRIVDNRGESGGGYCSRSAPAFTKCTFRENAAPLSGAYTAFLSTPSFDGCVFSNNQAVGEPYNQGGNAVFGGSSVLWIKNCLFQDNAGIRKAAIGLDASNARIVASDFIANEGGGISAGGWRVDSTRVGLRVENSRFIVNSAQSGGAVFADECPSVFLNCVFQGNLSETYGGAIYSGGTVIQNCTMAYNTSMYWGSAVYSRGGLQIENSILWENRVDPEGGYEGQVDANEYYTVINYSNLQNMDSDYCGLGNISTNPRFVDPMGADGIIGTADDDLRLRAASPCVDAGWNFAVPPDGFDLDQDGDVGEASLRDLDGNDRFVDAPFAADSGRGPGPIVDMGAYEASGPCVSIRSFRADCKGAGRAMIIVQTAFPEGKTLRVTRDGIETRRLRINAKGRGKLAWPDLSSLPHTFCVEECGERCREVECP